MASTRTPATRVFVDSSVLIAAALSSNGSAHDLIRLGSERRVALVISPLVVTEVKRNIRRKPPDRLNRLQDLLDTHPFEIVEPPATTFPFFWFFSSAFWMPSQSKPSWSMNLSSSAATTARLRWIEMSP